MNTFDTLFYPEAAPLLALRKDLEMLFNTRCDADLPDDLPELATSVLAYGLPSFARQQLGGADLTALCLLVRDRISTFVPRLTEVSVRAAAARSDGILHLHIEGRWQYPPRPGVVVLAATLNAEGRFQVQGESA